MSLLVTIVGGTLFVLAAGCGVYWTIGLSRILGGLRGDYSARAGLTMPAPAHESGAPQSVCVVVPCYNEAASVATVTRSLLAQDHPSLRVVFVLDRCTDDTRGAIERAAAMDTGVVDPRVEILEVRECPPGWAGKVHAMHSGVARSRGARDADMLLFIDADTELDPRCVRACAALLHTRGLDLLSLWSTLSTERWFERIVQPMTTLELIRQYPLQSANREVRPRAMANGQFMLYRAQAYHGFGGVESVRDSVLEDVAIARRMKRLGMRAGVLLAEGLLLCRMYDSYRAYRAGWKRIFIESASRRSPRLRAYAMRKAMAHLLLPGAAIATLAWGCVETFGARPETGSALMLFAGAYGVVPYLICLGILYASQGLLRYLPAAPVGNLLTISILFEAARDLRSGRPVRWGGREYELVDRGSKRDERRRNRAVAPGPSNATV